MTNILSESLQEEGEKKGKKEVAHQVDVQKIPYVRRRRPVNDFDHLVI